VHLTKNLPFDPVKDFTPIMAAVEPVTALIVNAEQINHGLEIFRQSLQEVFG
jgi:tripartite-type tricarboxylate transporter receptor subunit TctC